MTCNSVYPDAPRPAVGAVVFKDDKMLLVKRGKPSAEGYGNKQISLHWLTGR